MTRIRAVRARLSATVRSLVSGVAAGYRRWSEWADLDPSEKVMYTGLLMLAIGLAAVLDWADLPPLAALAVPGFVLVFAALRMTAPPKGGGG